MFQEGHYCHSVSLVEARLEAEKSAGAIPVLRNYRGRGSRTHSIF